MVKAVWNGHVLAESDRTIRVEGNHYFPPESIDRSYLLENQSHTVCPWKGVASYYDIQVDGQVNQGASWYYPNPSYAAKKFQNYVAFWRGVKIITRSYLKNGKLWFKSEMETSRWNLPMNNGK